MDKILKLLIINDIDVDLAYQVFQRLKQKKGWCEAIIGLIT